MSLVLKARLPRLSISRTGHKRTIFMCSRDVGNIYMINAEAPCKGERSSFWATNCQDHWYNHFLPTANVEWECDFRWNCTIRQLVMGADFNLLEWCPFLWVNNKVNYKWLGMPLTDGLSVKAICCWDSRLYFWYILNFKGLHNLERSDEILFIVHRSW